MSSVLPRDPDSDSGWRTSAAVDSSILSREHHHDATADPKIRGPGGTATPVPAAGRVAAAKQGGAPSPFPGEIENQGEWEPGTSGSAPRGRARLTGRLAQSRAEARA
jgi:hypothetical protein